MHDSVAFTRTFTKTNIRRIYNDDIRYKPSVGVDGINRKTFESTLNDCIDIICRKSWTAKYSFSQYKEKLISKGANKLPRCISIPTMRDKLLLRALLSVLILAFGDVSQSLHKIVFDIGQSLAQSKHDGVLRLDVQDFYPSINHDLLLKQLRTRIRSKRVLHLVRAAISQATVARPSAGERKPNDKGVPQGLSISNFLANIYMSDIDDKYSNREDLEYYRYVDDILILCDCSSVDQIRKELLVDCELLSLLLHSDDPEKCVSCKSSDGFSYLGYSFNGSTVSVRSKSVDKLRSSLIDLFTNYKHSRSQDLKLLKWSLELRITGCIFNNTKYGWLFFFSQINDLKLLGSLDHFVQTQIVRFGIDPGKFKLKRFIRSYHEITKNINNSRYIPNFDSYSTPQKRRILRDIFGLHTRLMSGAEIEFQFNRRIYRTVRDLEKDLARLS